ncbi:MAG: hypothetical protein QM758_25375 [Armatimonas sp.]
MNITSRLMLLAAASAAMILPARADYTSNRVTPENMGTFSVGFTVSARTTKGSDTTEYEVIIHRKALDYARFMKPNQGEVVRILQTDKNFGFEGVRPVKFKRVGTDQLIFRFNATPEEVSRMSFEVGFPNYAIYNGKRQWMPSADFYYLDLKDFAVKK